MNASIMAMCRCGHTGRRHTAELDGCCEAAGCECLGFHTASSVADVVAERRIATRNATGVAHDLPSSLQSAPYPPADDDEPDPAEPIKRCAKCGDTKPRDEFYGDKKARDGHQAWCKTCVNAQKKPQSEKRIVRVRARHRAVAELIRRYSDEFQNLLEQCRIEAEAEAKALAATPEAQTHYSSTDEGPPRLRSGRRGKGQSVEDRIDVARCPHCIKHHDRGHLCPECGTAPPPDVLKAWRAASAKQASTKQATSGGLTEWAAS